MTDSVDTTQLMTLDNLKDLGIDFKINKSDILDMLVEQARVSLTEERNAAKDESLSLAKECATLTKKETKAHWKSELKKVQADDSVRQLKSTLETFYEVKTKVVLDVDSSSYYLVPKSLKLRESSKNDGGCFLSRMNHDMYFMGPRAFYESMNRPNKELILPLNREPAKYKPSKELKALQEEKKEAEGIFRALDQKLNNFRYDAGRARIKVLRDFLGLTTEGQKLLGLLDSRRTGKQIISALKKENG